MNVSARREKQLSTRQLLLIQNLSCPQQSHLRLKVNTEILMDVISVLDLTNNNNMYNKNLIWYRHKDTHTNRPNNKP